MVSLSTRPIQFLDDHAPGLVSAYFERGDQGYQYTGAMFERFGEGGDRPDNAGRFTADDLVAVTMLSVEVPPPTALRLLVDDVQAIEALLSQVPNGVDIWEVERSVLEDGKPADQLWRQLTSMPGVAWVIAGKLLARKRPRLLPVYDDVVREALGRPKDFWLSLWDEFQADNQALVARLAAVRDEAGIGDDISLLRVLDVAIWMRNHGKRDARDATLQGLEPIHPG